LGRGWHEEDVAQGSLSSLAAFLARRDFDGAAFTLGERCFERGQRSANHSEAARQVPAPMEEPQDRKAGPALPLF